MGRGRKGRRRRSRTSHTVRAPARRRARAARGGRLDRGLYPGHGPRDDPRFDEWIFSHHERTYDARIERYQRLIATTKRWEYDLGRSEAQEWLMQRLRRRVADSTQANAQGTSYHRFAAES